MTTGKTIALTRQTFVGKVMSLLFNMPSRLVITSSVINAKKIEENNRMGKTRDLFKKIRDTKKTFHAKMGTIKDRNGVDLTEAEDIKKRRKEDTEQLYKKRSS